MDEGWATDGRRMGDGWATDGRRVDDDTFRLDSNYMVVARESDRNQTEISMQSVRNQIAISTKSDRNRHTITNNINAIQMASARGLLSKISGTIDKELVFKQYANKTVVTKYPDMSKVKPTEFQRRKRSMFADAVVYARAIIRDREKKALYAKKVKKGQTVYHYAIKEYMAAHKGDVVKG